MERGKYHVKFLMLNRESCHIHVLSGLYVYVTQVSLSSDDVFWVVSSYLGHLFLKTSSA